MRTYVASLQSGVEQMLTHTTLKPEPGHIVIFSVGSDNLKAHANIFFLFLVLVNLNYISFLFLRRFTGEARFALTAD